MLHQAKRDREGGGVNALKYRDSYRATSNNMKLVHPTLAVDRWAVTFGTARRGLGGAAARPGPFLAVGYKM